MKKLFTPLLISVATATLLTGCIGLQVGGGAKSEAQKPSLGQQLIDLKNAKDAHAITDAEYEAEKAKLLNDSK
ncbi:MAG TPA: SHOCT domain-containing protein [Verrucomicrobiae bacterium]|jgi:hypothetical protein